MKLVDNHMVFVRHKRDPWTPSGVRRLVRKVGQENIEALMALRRADVVGSGRDEDPVAEEQEFRTALTEAMSATAAFSVKDLAVKGPDVMAALGCKPGPQVGEVLKKLLERVLDNPELNTVETLTALAKEVA